MTAKDQQPVKPKKVENKVKDLPQTKIVVRKLPPSLTLDKFLEEVSPLPDYTYLNYVPADRSLGASAFCRAVINFKNPDDVFLFTERFDEYVFVDAKGTEYLANVEYAPYHKVPTGKRAVNKKEDSLNDDPEYKKFVEEIENPQPKVFKSAKETLEEMDAQAKLKQAAKTETPLLAYINKQKLEKRKAQEKRREELRKADQERKKQRDEERRQRRAEKSAKHTYSSSSGAKSSTIKEKYKDDEVTVVTIPRGGKSAPKKPTDRKPGDRKSSKPDDKEKSIPPAADKRNKTTSECSEHNETTGGPSECKNSSKSDERKAESETVSESDEVTGASETDDANKGTAVPKSTATKREERGRDSYQRKHPREGAKDSQLRDNKKTAKKEETEASGDSCGRPRSSKFANKDYGDVEVRTIERKKDKPGSAAESRSSSSNEGDKSRKKRPERPLYNPAARFAERRKPKSDN